MHRKEYLAYYALMIICLGVLVFARFFYGNQSECISVVSPADSVPVAWRYRQDTVHINTASALQLRRFGFSNREVVSILSYRDAGGHIRDVERLKKIYGVDTIRLSRCSSRILYDDVMVTCKRKYDNETRSSSSSPRKGSRRIGLFYADSLQLMSLGVSPSIWDSLVSYRKRYILKGSVPVDSLVSADIYNIGNILSPHVSGVRRDYTMTAPAKTVVIELNSASVDDLCRLKMVAEKTAKAIVEYRSRLGGFVSVDQLHEVWLIEHFGSFDMIASQCHVDKSSIVKLSVNKVREKVLASHPYFDKHAVDAVMQYRLLKGSISSVDDFRDAMGMIDYNPFLEEYLEYEK